MKPWSLPVRRSLSSLLENFNANVKIGYFDTAASNPYRAIGWDAVNTPTSQTLARDAATMGMTLLKNDGLLPYKFANGTDCTVAMIGMWANGTTQMQGNVSLILFESETHHADIPPVRRCSTLPT